MKQFAAGLTIFASQFAAAIVLPTHTQTVWVNMGSAPPAGFYNYDMHLRWHQEPDVSQMGFYAQFYFAFQAGSGGYMGLQQDKIDGKKAIFSIWDQNGRQTARPATASCKRFGHEGTGTSCIVPFAWKAGHEYKLRIWRLSANAAAKTEQWGGWVIDYQSGEETLIGVVEVADSAGHTGYGGLAADASATLEFYGPTGENGVACRQLPYFGATWNGPFGNNGEQLPRRATLLYAPGIGSDCTGHTNTSANAPFSFTSEVGGAVATKTPQRSSLWDRFPYASYAATDCLYNWAERNFPAVFGQAPFRQRRISQSLFGYYLRDYRHHGDGYALIADTATGELLAGLPGGDMVSLGRLEALKRQAMCSP